MQYKIVEMHHLTKIHSSDIQKTCLSMFSNTGQNHFIFYLPPDFLQPTQHFHV